MLISDFQFGASFRVRAARYFRTTAGILPPCRITARLVERSLSWHSMNVKMPLDPLIGC
jgi:hypothetical protein